LQPSINDVAPSHGAFLPADRRRELAGRGRVPDRSTGAALFADISGFTKLTEELGRTMGPRRGAEELTTLLNRVFGSITSAVDSQGGSVISFGGDSVICWFEGDVDGWRATTVGLEIVEVLREFRERETGPGAVLDIKAAVATGQAHRMRVGKAAHAHMDVLAGDVNIDLVAEARLLRAGEVAVTASVADALEGRVKITMFEADGRTRYLVDEVNERPTPIASHVDDLYPNDATDWMLPIVRQHLDQGLGGLMGQLRDVVTMFVGFDAAPAPDTGPDAETFGEFVARVQDVVASL
jgi:class 3 adenylate cyclase